MAPARILVVDDNSGLLYAVSRCLMQAGHEVFPACEPKQALDIVRNVSPLDLVVADMRMPQMSGAELIREISAITRGIIAVLMTAGIPDRRDLPNGVQVLRKPFSMKELAFVLERLLARPAQPIPEANMLDPTSSSIWELARVLEQNMAQSAQLSAELQSHLHRAATLQRQSQQLCCETGDTILKGWER